MEKPIILDKQKILIPLGVVITIVGFSTFMYSRFRILEERVPENLKEQLATMQLQLDILVGNQNKSSVLSQSTTVSNK